MLSPAEREQITALLAERDSLRTQRDEWKKRQGLTADGKVAWERDGRLMAEARVEALSEALRETTNLLAQFDGRSDVDATVTRARAVLAAALHNPQETNH